MAFKITVATTKLLALKKRLRFIAGGTSASKTISILMILIDYCQTNRFKKVDVMSESYPHLEDGAIKDFREIMLDRGYWKDSCWNDTKHIYSFETGTKLKFISIDKLGKAHGPRRDILFMNEINNIPYAIYDQLEIRTKEVIWGDWNPTTEFWYYTQIKDKVDHDFLILTYLDCIDVLDQNIIDTIEAKKHKKNWWRVYGLGLLGEVEGKIYNDWKEIDEIPHEAKLERRGLDFGYTNDPTVIVDIYKYNGGFIIDEILYQKGMSNSAIADFLNVDGKGNILTIADSAEPKSIDEISERGVNIVGAQKGPGSVNQGIDFVKDQKISITKRSLKTIKAYRNYVWTTNKKDGKVLNVPDDTIHEWSNSMDAIRYGLDSYRHIEGKDEEFNMYKTTYN